MDDHGRILWESLLPPPDSAIPATSPMAHPTSFSGEAVSCNGFLLQCSLYFELQSHQFATERAKVAFISLLNGRALQLEEALWSSRSPRINSLEDFVEHFREVFSQPTTEISVHDELFQLRQDDSSIHEYTLRFRTLAVSSGWNEVALLSAYRRGLNPTLRQQMSIYDDSVGFESFLQRAARVSQRLTACHTDSLPIATASPSRSLPVPEPMITDTYHLSILERSRRLTQGLCLYCGSAEHQLRACPIRPPRPVVSTIQIAPDISNMSLVDALLRYQDQSFPVKILMDSGAAGNFISSRALTGFKIPRRRNDATYQITTVQGKPLGRGLVRYHTPEVSLHIGCFHIERISLLVLEEAVVDVVLGRPWLAKHQPTIDWRSGEILKWNSGCKQRCLRDLPVPVSNKASLSICSTSIESPETYQVTHVPPGYQSFKDVFSKEAATHLPPHRPWDCCIDLRHGAKLPKGHIYPLSIPERTAMEEYVKEALNQGFIRPSTSPAASSFFFVAKKDGGLRPCIDYRVLNDQTVKFAYPLPLVPAALEELCGACIFSKLDLRSAYNLIRIRRGDEWKTAFVTPTGHYEYRVMPYGLSNSPSIFQNFMNEIFRDMINRFVLIYIDDILIYSPTMEEHRRHVTQVLQRLRQHHLYLKTEKCEFHKSTIHFLGYIVTPAGVQMDQRKAEAVKNWPQPTMIKEMQRFLGFANFYRRFIAHYSQLAAPLTSFLRLSHIQTPISALWSKLMRRPWEWVPFCPNGRVNPPYSIHVRTSQRNCPRRSRTTTWVIGSCWPSSSLWKSGGIG